VNLVPANLYKIGNKNAAVFPDPVIELANTSFPEMIIGIACF